MSDVTNADDFLDSIGVNVHWDYPDTPYGYAYEDVRDLLFDSGVRHVRGQALRAQELAEGGVSTTVVVDLSPAASVPPAQQLAGLKSLAASGAVVAVEGPNEPDLFWKAKGYTYRGQGFPEGPLLWQQDLFAAVQDDPLLNHLTVIAPSLGGTYWSGNLPYPVGALAGVADWGNFHPYPARNTFTRPLPYAGLARYYWDSDTPSGTLDKHPINLTTYRPLFGRLPMAATESGYSTWRLGQSERAQGKYLPRVFLENFRLGIERTYSYEFIDEFLDPTGGEREAHFGMVRRDLTPKPAYNALRSLIGALETSPASSPGAPLTYDLAVTPPPGYDPSYLHHLALRRADGSHVIALWHEVSANDLSGLDAVPPQPIREIAQPAMDVALELGGRGEGVTVQTIGDDGFLHEGQATRRGNTYDIRVPDRVTLVTIPAVGVDDDVAGLRRVAGDDRVGTSLAVARDRLDVAAGVVLAASDDFADALAGAPLAEAVGGPLLLNPRASLDVRVSAYLRDEVAPGATVHVLGGDQALSPVVEQQVLALGLNVVRVAGSDRYATSVAVAERLVALGVGGCDVLLATGRGFADGASAAGSSSAHRPLLFTDGPRLPPVAARHLANCGARATATAVGGPASSALAGAAHVRGSSFAGEDRYATSALLAGAEASASDDRRLVLTTGRAFPDALVGGTYGSPVLLTEPTSLSPSASALMEQRSSLIDEIVVVGGSAAVDPRVAKSAAVAAARG